MKRIAWLSPYTDASGTKAAYQTKVVVPQLREFCEVRVFADEAGEDWQDFAPLPLSHLEFEHRQNNFDVLAYQLEDNPQIYPYRRHFHETSRELSGLSEVPRFVWFHDWYLRPEPWELEFQQEVLGVSGLPGNLLVEELRNSHLAAFSCERNCQEALTWFAQANVAGERSALPGGIVYLPYAIKIDRQAKDIAQANGKYLRIAACARPLLEYRLQSLLYALRGFGQRAELRWMLDLEERSSASELCQACDFHNVEFISPRSPAHWQELVVASDLAFHAWYSAYGDPGPYLQLSLGSGAQTIVLDYASTRFLPKSVAHKITGGEGEIAAISEILGQIAADPGVRNLAGQEHVEVVHDFNIVARELFELCERSRRLSEGVENLR